MQMFLFLSALASWMTLLLVGFVLLGTLRSMGLLSWRLEQLEATTPSRVGRSGLKPGKRAPDFHLPSIAGGAVSLSDFAGRKVLLVFVQTGCGPCQTIVPALNRLHHRARKTPHVEVLVVTNAEITRAREWTRAVGAQFSVLLQQDWRLSKRYEVFATPFAFLINECGVVVSKGVVNNRQHIGYVLSAVDTHSSSHRETMKQTTDPKLDEFDSFSPEEVTHV